MKITRFLVLFLFVSLFASHASAKERADTCAKNPMYCQILEWRPKINKKWAMKFSDLLFRYGKKFHMDPWRSLAIAMQETRLRNIHRKHSIIIFADKCKKEEKCKKTFSLYRGYSDLSIFQFHIDTALAYKMNILRLDTDLAYAVKEHFVLLKLKEKRCKDLGAVAWSCYHSRTYVKRKLYTMLVNRFFIPVEKRGEAKKTNQLVKCESSCKKQVKKQPKPKNPTAKS